MTTDSSAAGADPPRPAYTEGLTQLGSGGGTQPSAALEVFPNPHPDRVYHIHIESRSLRRSARSPGSPILRRWCWNTCPARAVWS